MTGGTPLVGRYDQVIFDLDGVLILGDQPVPGAPDAVRRLREHPVSVVYATNNASRSPDTVAELLTGVGIPAAGKEVLTSATAAASLLAERFPAASPVLVVGAPALVEAVRAVGLRTVAAADEAPVVVVQGYGPRVGWADLAEASVAIRAGAGWIATNTDRTLPSPRGPLPGNGSLVAALATALGRQPDTAVGKPEPGLFLQAAAGAGARRPLVVGDRLDTDIEGARRAGMDSLLVLTGVTRPADLLAAPEPRRPTYLAADLDGLFTDEPTGWAGTDGGEGGRDAVGGGWRVRRDGGAGWILAGDGSPVAALRALCQARWSADADDGGRTGTPDPGDTAVTGDGEPARRALRSLGLA